MAKSINLWKMIGMSKCIMKTYLSPRTDYEPAAEFSNKCRKKGVQVSHIDFLICAVANRIDIPIFINDKDFEHYQNNISIELFKF
jgi:predicted nucleic acid-binding protein